MGTTVTDRISSAKIYLEPDIYTLAQQEAKKEDVTLSHWVRKLMIAELLKREVLTPDIVLKIATG